MRYNFLLLFLIIILSEGKAVKPFYPLKVDPLTELWRFTHFPELDGKGVRSFVKDHRNNYWFGVNDGVVCYDGFIFKFYTHVNGFDGRDVNHLLVTSAGELYAAASCGILQFKNGKWKNIFPIKGVYNFTFTCLKELSDGSLACGLPEGLLLLSKQGNYLLSTPSKSQYILKQLPHLTFISFPFGDGFQNVSDILEDKPGNIWIAVSLTEYGKIFSIPISAIYKNKIAQFTVYSHATGVALGEQQKFLKASNNDIWVINKSYKVGTMHFDGNRWNKVQFRKLGGDEYTTSIAQTADGTIWIGGLGKLYCFTNKRWQVYKAPANNIPSSQVLVFPDTMEKLWIAGFQSKISLVDLSNTGWLTLPQLNFQSKDNKNNEWFISAKGEAVLHHNGHWLAYNESDGFMDSPVKIITTSKGHTWAAGSHHSKAATAVFINGRWQTEVHPYLSWGIDYRSVYEATDGSLWFGGCVDHDPEKQQLGGILQFKNPKQSSNEWIHHKYRYNGLVQSSIYGIAQSPEGNIFIGGRTLLYLKGGWHGHSNMQFRQFINIVHSNKQKLYVGSRYYGIWIFDGKTWKQYNTQNGLASNTIISLASSGNNQLYAATENDISYFDGTTWITSIFPQEMNMANEGGNIQLENNDCVWINLSSRDWKRRALSELPLSSNTYENFKAYRYLHDKVAPRTRIHPTPAEVPAEDNFVVGWTAGDYLGKTPANRLQYSYRINDSLWSVYSEKTSHTFSGLQPGSYTLEVRSRDLDFNVDTSAQKVEFNVLPPIWRQPWLVALVVLFLCMLILLEIRIIRKNKILTLLNVSLEEVNQDLHAKNITVKEQHEIISNNHKQLELSNKVLENKNQEIEQQMESLHEMIGKVEILSKAKVNFFTNITHEFRTPLTLIEGPLERLFSQDMNEAEKANWYKIAQKNLSRLRDLINQLLLTRDSNQGVMALVLRTKDLITFAQEIVNLFQNLANERHICLQFHTEMKTAVMAFDQDKIEKVIYNLIGNAIKYTASGGKITVKMSIVQHVAQKESILIEVADTGRGIPTIDIPNLFEKKKHISDNTIHPNDESSGIGLPHVKQLLDEHGGSIEVTSIVGKGSVFSVYIPADIVDAEDNGIQIGDLSNEIHIIPASADTIVSHFLSGKINDKKKTILLVEDNPEILFMLAEILKPTYNLFKSSNGSMALDICNSYDIDLIVSDIMMPQMDGLTLCHQVKSNFETSHIPVVLLTAVPKSEKEIDGYTLGADAYIEKPFSSLLLLARIQGLIQSRINLQQKFIQQIGLKPKDVTVVSEDEKFLKRLSEIMEKHISDPEFDIDVMCGMLNRSHVQFIRKVKQLTGKKPVDLLKTFRLQRAKQLLEQDKINISEVAWMVGYDLPNSFSRAFKKEYGLSPTDFVEKIRQTV